MENFRDFRKDNRMEEYYRDSLLPQIKSSLDEWVVAHEGARYKVEEYSSPSNKYLITVEMNRIPILELVAYDNGSILKIRRIGYIGLSEFEPKDSDIGKLLDAYLPVVEELNNAREELKAQAKERLSDIAKKLPEEFDVEVYALNFGLSHRNR